MPTLTRFYGRNGADAPNEIVDLESTKCQNLFISGRSLKQRGGVSQELLDSAAPSNPIWGAHRSYIVDGTPFWVYSLGTLVRSNRTGSQATIKTLASSNKGVGFVEFNGSIYILPANTTDKVQKSDGTAGGTADHADADTPKASLGAIHNGQRMVLNDLNNLSHAWLSDTNDPDTFRNQETATVETQGGFIKISPGDGDRIKAISPFGSSTFFLKERSLHMLIGNSFTGDEEFRRIELYRGVGTKSPRSVKQFENGLIFLDSDGIIRFFYAPARRLISVVGRHIEDLTKATPAAFLEEASAFVYDRKYFISFAGSGQAKNTETWCLDGRTISPFLKNDQEEDMPSGWTEITGWEWNIGLVTDGQSDTALPYFGDSNSTGKIWKFLSGTTDNGSAIPYAYISKAYGVDDPTSIKAISEITTASRTMSAAIVHEAYANLATTATATKSLTPPSTTLSINTWKTGETVRGNVVQVGFSGSSSVGGEVFSLDWEWAQKRKDVVDG